MENWHTFLYICIDWPRRRRRVKAFYSNQNVSSILPCCPLLFGFPRFNLLL